MGSTTGCVPAPKGYFKAMHSVCKKYGALYILDEVMSGMGRKEIPEYHFLLLFISVRRHGYSARLAKLRRWYRT